MTLRALAAFLACAACHHAREPKPQLVIEIRAQLPGAGAEEVAASVTNPLENELASVPHIASLTSESTAGLSRVRVAFDGDDVSTAQQATQAALSRVMRMLPATMAGPPTYSVVGAPVGRFLVPRNDATAAVERVRLIEGVGAVEMCGERRVEKTITLDSTRLAMAALTVTDVADALRDTPQRPDLAEALLVVHNGVPVLLRDVAVVADSVVPPACTVDTPSSASAELVIAAQHAAKADMVRSAVLKSVTGAIAVPRGREPHVQLAPDVDLDKAVFAVHQALMTLDRYVVEVRPGSALILDGGEPALAALRQLPVVLGAGEPTSVVHISGADASAVASAARAISERLQRAGTLVASHGLAISTTLRIDVDRDRAAELGVSTSDLATTVAATRGFVATTVYGGSRRVSLRVEPVAPHAEATLYVHGTAGLVPLASLTTAHETTGPVEVVHRNRLPDVDLEVHGDPSAAIGAVPAGIRVEVEPYP